MMSIAPRTVAAPDSSATRLGRRERSGRDDDAGQQRRARADPGLHEVTDAAVLHRRAWRGHRACCGIGAGRVAAGGQSGGLPGGVDAADLGGDGSDSAEATQQHHHQCGDGQGRLDRARTGIAYTLVFSARLMMLVNAPTIESPVTTL